MLISGGSLLRYDAEQFATNEANSFSNQLISTNSPDAQFRSCMQQLTVRETAAPIAKEKDPKKKRKWTRVGIPPRKCQVCNDGAYGFNYGAVTCESCKAFFRRHLNKTDIQACPGVNNCEMTKKTRKYCPSCRLNKCVQVGMRPEVNPLKHGGASKSDCDSQSQSSTKPDLTPSVQSQAGPPTCASSSSAEAAQTALADVCNCLGKRMLCTAEFNQMRKYCNMLVLTMNEPFAQNDLNSMYKADPSSPFDLFGLGEALLKRFVRFVKKIPQFCDNFTFEEKIFILKKSLFSCHIFNGIYSYDAGGRKVMLDDGRWKMIPRGYVLERLKKIGITPDETDMLNMTRWVNLNMSLRDTFPSCWQLITAALTMITLFSPDYYDCGFNSLVTSSSSSSLSSTTSATTSASTAVAAANAENTDLQRNLNIRSKLLPLFSSYTLFITDYIAHLLAEQGVHDSKQLAQLSQYCMRQLHDVRIMTTTLSDRIGFIIALDPASAVNAIPLYYELRDR